MSKMEAQDRKELGGGTPVGPSLGQPRAVEPKGAGAGTPVGPSLAALQDVGRQKGPEPHWKPLPTGPAVWHLPKACLQLEKG